MLLSIFQNLKRNLVPNPATPIYGSLIRARIRSYSSVLTFDEFNLKKEFLRNIKIYNNGSIKDPVEDYQTLKLFNDLDKFLREKNKDKVIQCVESFILNKDGKYDADYGKAKQQLGDILYSHRKDLKITPLDILKNFGFQKNELLEMGVLETTLLKTKTCVSSTVFEILVMDTLPEKYNNIQKVYYCQDGANMIKCINLTGQKNHDYVVEFKNERDELIRVAFDSKVQKFDTFIANLKNRGLNYQILTLGSISDDEIKKNSIFQKAISDFGKKKKNLYYDFEKVKEKNLEDPEDIMSESFISTMFINTEDLSNNIVNRRLKKNFNNEKIDKDTNVDDIF